MIIIILFILGLAVGSFLNVLIDRLPHNISVIKGRSQCDRCRHQLSWLDLIPLFSFVMLGRKCRYCYKSISWYYPIVESITAISFICIYSSMIQIIELKLYLQFLYYLVIVSSLIVIFFADLKYRVIPNQIIIVLLIFSFAYQARLGPNYLINHLLSGLGMLTLFLFLFFITRGRGMGLGDVKFSFIMGLILGFPKIIPAFYLSFLTGALISLILIGIGRKTIKSTIPFGPFLVIAMVISLFYGDSLWQMLKNIWGI